MRRLTAGVATVLLLGLAPGPATAQAFDPDAPIPADSKLEVGDLTFSVEELHFRIDPVGGAVEALEVKETATEIRIQMAADVLFDFDQAEIRPDAATVLAEVAALLRRHPGRRVVVEGHTDAKGDDRYNLRLSERRAEAVRRWLQGQEGLGSVALQTRGWGARRPAAPNTRPDGSDDPQGRQKNRRVEIVIAKPSR